MVKFLRGLFIACALVGICSVNSAKAAEVTELLMASSNAPEALISKMAEKFVEKVNQSGVVKINLIVGQALGEMSQVMESHMEGSVDIAYDRPLWFAPFVDDFNVLSWGFTFENKAHLDKFYKSELYQGMVDQVVKKLNVRILGSASDLPRELFTVEKVSSIADIQGIKMRVPRLEPYVKLWEALGTKPTQIAWSEAYLALKTGIVSGIEVDLPNALVQKFHTVAPNISLTDHIISGFFISINEDKWKTLTPEQKEVLQQASDEVLKWASIQAEIVSKKAVEKMTAEGAVVNKIDKTEFIKKSKEKVAEMEAAGLWRTGLWADIQKLK